MNIKKILLTILVAIIAVACANPDHDTPVPTPKPEPQPESNDKNYVKAIELLGTDSKTNELVSYEECFYHKFNDNGLVDYTRVGEDEYLRFICL